jgi:hypothetical protein
MAYQINKEIMLQGTWDFAEDGGATGTFPLISVPANFVVLDIWYQVETAITSGGTPTVEIGDGDDVDGYFADFQASMGTTGFKGLDDDEKGALYWDNTNDAAQHKKYTTADTIDFKVATAALTAGKLNVFVKGIRLA